MQIEHIVNKYLPLFHNDQMCAQELDGSVNIVARREKSLGNYHPVFHIQGSLYSVSHLAPLQGQFQVSGVALGIVHVVPTCCVVPKSVPRLMTGHTKLNFFSTVIKVM